MAKSNAIRQMVVSMVVLAVCGGVAFGLSKWSKPPKKDDEPTPIPLVESRIMVPESMRFSVNSQGVARPSVETRLVAEVGGVVRDVSPVFVSGGLFSKGDTLIQIDDSDYRVALSQAEANLAASEARLQEEEAKAEAEQKSWLRSGKKLKTAPDLLLRKPYVAEAKANVKAAKAQLAKARRDLERTQIKAPYDGMVRVREVNLGQYVSTGGSVGSIFTVSDMEIRLPVKSSDLAFVDLPPAGRSIDAGISVEIYQRLGNREVIWEARLARVEGVVDDKSRMHYVVAKVNDPYGLQNGAGQFPLKAGSFVRARIQGNEVAGLFSVPRSAVYGDGRVLVIDEDDSLRFRKVSVLYGDENDIYLNAGLQAGDRVCLTPLSSPVEGTRVQILATEDSKDASVDYSLAEG